jgi:hypothetical protein
MKKPKESHQSQERNETRQRAKVRHSGQQGGEINPDEGRPKSDQGTFGKEKGLPAPREGGQSGQQRTRTDQN